MADTISSLDQQCINHFVNTEYWSYRCLIDEIAQQASNLFNQTNTPTSITY